MHVMGRAEERLRIPPYGSNPKMPEPMLREMFYKSNSPLPRTKWKGSRLLNRPSPIPDDIWTRAFAHSTPPGGCPSCSGKGRRWVKKSDKGTAQRRVECEACRGTGRQQAA